MHIISCLFFYVYLVFELKFIILKEAFNKLGNGGIMILKEIHIFIAITDIHTFGAADKSLYYNKYNSWVLKKSN